MSRDRVSQVIFDYATQIGGARETDASLRLNADMARDLMGAERCSIWLLDHKAHQLWTKVAHGVGEIRIAMGQGIVGAAIEANEVVVVNDTSKDERFLKPAPGAFLPSNMVVIPLRGADGKVIGAIQVMNKPGGFEQEDVDLLGLAATYSGSALETQMLREEAVAARLLQKELDIAKNVQERLFPQSLPKIPGLECEAYCRPAKSVGGDYYDFITMPDGSLFFTLGDVSGKGIGAAVLMASIQASIRTQTVKLFDSIAELVSVFNKAIYSFSLSDKYSTLFCGHYLPETRELRYVNAGQARPMLYKVSTGVVEELDSSGFPVGLLPMAMYEHGTVVLEPGDVMVSFSDGLSEATNEAGDMWSEHDVRREFQARATLGAKELLHGLIEAADGFAGAAEQADDMTVMVLKVVG